MPDTKEKPDPFKPGAALTARALSLLRDAVPRLFRGAGGVAIKKIGDKYIFTLEDEQGTRPGTVAIVEILTVHDTYLTCRKDGQATILVAKPWGLRKGVQWPAGAVYTYASADQRTATWTTTETQRVTPSYMVGEQLLAVRLASTRIQTTTTSDGVPIYWEDINQAGRCWAAV